MAAKTILLILLFVLCSGGAIWVPLLGIMGYMAHYILGPDRQWWAAEIRPYGIRYSFLLAVMIAIGLVVNRRHLRYGRRLLTTQEWLLLAFVALVWLLWAASEPSAMVTREDPKAVKLAKAVVFCLMLSHAVTDVRSLWCVVWAMVICALLLGLQAYAAPRSAFYSGRLENIGGVDFAESNGLPAFIGAVLPLIGVAFIRSGLAGKAIALLAGAFSANAVILTRSRGGFVGIAMGGIAAALMAPGRYRAKVLVGLVVAGLGAAYLMDPGFIGRMRQIETSAEKQDASSRSRVEIWQASVRMLKDHPLGVGPENFLQAIGRYDPRHGGRDAHSTFVRCFAELGIPGLALFVALILNAIRVALRAMRLANGLPREYRDELLYLAYGLAVGLCIMIGCGLTMTLLYLEAHRWFLVLPVCVERAVGNLAEDLRLSPLPALAKGQVFSRVPASGRRPSGTLAPSSEGGES